MLLPLVSHDLSSPLVERVLVPLPVLVHVLLLVRVLLLVVVLLLPFTATSLAGIHLPLLGGAFALRPLVPNALSLPPATPGPSQPLGGLHARNVGLPVPVPVEVVCVRPLSAPCVS